MTDDLRDLYQEVILDHNKRPRNRGRLDHVTNKADGYNPICGDHVHLELEIADGVIKDVRFEGQGCAISTASASLMTEAIQGKTPDQAEAIFGEMQSMLTKSEAEQPSAIDDELMALSGVREYPVRIKCAILPWHALREALSQSGEIACTE